MTSPTDSADLASGEIGARGRTRKGRGKGRGRRHRRDASPGALGGGKLDFGPRPMAFEARPAPEDSMFRRKRKVDVGAILAGLFGLGTLMFVLVLVYRGTRVDVAQEGLEDGAFLDADALADMVVTLDVGSPDRLEGATLELDGEPVEEPEADGQVITWRPGGELEEGEHALVLRVPRPAIGDAEFRWDFTVDTTAPELEVERVSRPVAIDEPTTVRGTAEPGTVVTADGRDAEVGDDGAFMVEFARPPAGALTVQSVDEAGNVTTVPLAMPVASPSPRAVHVTAASWTNPPLRNGVFQLLEEGRVDTVVLDLKGEDGVVGYDTQVARAREIGAVTPYYDLEDLIASVESRGGRVVGRISAFRDPILARAAWAAGQGDQVVQTPDGRPYEEPGEFTNFASPAVRRYNLDIALDAVSRGVDDILWDDVRKPRSGDDTMLVPGLSGTPAETMVTFLAEAHAELRRRGAFQGVTTAGIALTDPALVGQDIGDFARNADYLVPTIHPGDWSSGSFSLPSPATAPYDTVFRALEQVQQMASGTGVWLVPSLQDFSSRGVTYGDGEVRAEIDAARARGVDRFLLWDPSMRYAVGALDPRG